MGLQLHACAATLLATALLAGASSAGAAETFHYLNVAGSSFMPRDASTKTTYDSGGCVWRSAGADKLVYPVHLPNGSRIKYLRLYYNDTSATKMEAYLTRFDGAGDVTDEIHVSNETASNGYGYVISAEAHVVIDNETAATQLVTGFDENAASLQFCGVRLAYYLPLEVFKDSFE